MLKKKFVYVLSLIVIISFIFITICTTYLLNKVNTNEVRNKSKITESIKTNKDIENEIRLEYLSLKQIRKIGEQNLLFHNFMKNIKDPNDIYNRSQLENIWGIANKWVTKERLYDIQDKNLGKVINSLKNAKITYANIYSKGTQLKILLLLEGDQKAVFKPQWYDKEEIILGNVYAGNDRYGAEILAFYLSGILKIPLAPIATERIININKEIFPVAAQALLDTSFQKYNKSCIYGKCFYCSKEKPACEKSPGKFHGAIIFHIAGKFNRYRSPWQRTYKEGKKSLWEYENNYCLRIKQQLSQNILLDLIDTAIFDFMIQNGDRHHFETLNDKVILFDNGKGLGNPDIHHLDILAPLYQCCMLRQETLNKLQKISEVKLSNILKSIDEIRNVVTDKHLNAIEERFFYVMATIERCIKQNTILLF